MAQEHNLNPITHRQKYFVCYQCCFWIAQLLIIALGITVMAKVIIGYQITKEVVESNQYLHSEETVWLWNKGTVTHTQDTSSISKQKKPIIAQKDIIHS